MNGYQIADLALKNGIAPERAFHYMGVDHFLTTQQTANHRFAGVKKLGALGILKSTYGLPFFNQDPAGSSNNALSGLGIVTRTDYGFEFCGSTSYYKELWIDINTTT